MKTKQLLIKSILVALAITLFIAGIPMKDVSATENELTQQEAVKILEALDNSSVKKVDGTVLISENQLEKELKGNPDYLQIKKELKKSGVLTSELADKSMPTVKNMAPMMAKASSSQINPKWKAVRDACARKYLSSKYGVAALGGTFALIMSKNYRKAVLDLLKKGASVSVPGLMAVYVNMNYVCIKKANAKHKVYK